MTAISAARLSPRLLPWSAPCPIQQKNQKNKQIVVEACGYVGKRPVDLVGKVLTKQPRFLVSLFCQWLVHISTGPI